MPDASVTIVGAGVVGLAIAAEVSRKYSPVFVLERHGRYGQETSSRNSEVIHAGIYYPHGSLKARLCVEGKKLLYDLCTAHNIPHKRIGKIITATSNNELEALHKLYDHALGNGVQLDMLSAERVHSMEPNIASMGGILSSSTGIVSAHGLMDYFYHTAKEQGTEVQSHCEVVGIERRASDFQITISESGQRSTFTTEWLINAAGLESDTIARLAGLDPDSAGYRLHHAKGSYFAVTGTKRMMVSRLIYPVPPRESLGVHAVVDLGGGLKFGPDVEYLANRTIDYSVDASKLRTFGESVRRIVPSIKDEDLTPDMSGIRAKLQAKGEPPKDFIIKHESDGGLTGLINLIGIDSPGLTASPAIARYVAGMMRS